MDSSYFGKTSDLPLRSSIRGLPPPLELSMSTMKFLLMPCGHEISATADASAKQKPQAGCEGWHTKPNHVYIVCRITMSGRKDSETMWNTCLPPAWTSRSSCPLPRARADDELWAQSNAQREEAHSEAPKGPSRNKSWPRLSPCVLKCTENTSEKSRARLFYIQAAKGVL